MGTNTAGTGTAVWLAVTGTQDSKIDAAQGRCECTGQCGRSHGTVAAHQRDAGGSPPGRCHVEDGPGRRLTVAPAAPGLPWTIAARLPDDALAVWCAACLTGAERAERRHRAAEHTAQQPDLFDLFDQPDQLDVVGDADTPGECA